MALNVTFSRTNRVASLPPAVPDHELLRCIGGGSYGEVWLARNVMGTYRAVKVVHRDSFADERPYEREFSGLQKFEPVSRSHDGFVDILQVGRNDPAGYYYCVMELADDAVFGHSINPLLYQPKTLGQELSSRERLSINECVEIGVALAAALGHLHESGLIHRDIKPSNIIFVNGTPKIADIGLVTELGMSHSLVGTEGFMPPEGPGTVEADLYSLGKVLYEISTGRDRKAFPEIPTEAAALAASNEFIELNEVILRACERDLQKRYRSAREMHHDLVLLQAGKSVKRLRLLERRMLLLQKAGVLAAAVLATCVAVAFQVNREIKSAAEKRQQQVGRSVAYGTRFVDEGDYFGALPRFVEALGLDHAENERQAIHRLRIGSTLQQCPRLGFQWVLDAKINCGQLSRDGRYLLAACADGTTAICDLETKSISVLRVDDPVELEGAAFSWDGKFIVTTGTNRVDLWEVSTGRRVLRFAPPLTVYNAQFSPDGRWIVTASGDENHGYLQLWDANSGRLAREISTIVGAYRFASFSPDGTRLAAAGENKRVQLWDVANDFEPGASVAHNDWAYYATFSPDGSRLLSTCFDGTVLISDPVTGRALLPPLRHPAGVKTAEFSPDGRYLATAGWDFTTRIWDLSTGELVFPFLKSSSKHVMYAAFRSQGRQVVTTASNGVLALWELASAGFCPPASQTSYSRDGERSATIQGEAVAIRSVRDQKLISQVIVDGEVKDAKLNRDGTRLAVFYGITNQAAQVFDAASGKPISSPFDVHAPSPKAKLDDGGNRLVTSFGRNAQIWDARTGRLIHSLAHEDDLQGAWFSRDGKWMVTCTRNMPETLVWEVATGELIHRLSTDYSVRYAEFSPDGTRLIVCTGDGTLFERYAILFDAATGQRVGSVLDHLDGVDHASFSEDGRRVVTASPDHTARVWDAETGRRLLVLPHKNQVTEASFSPDGKLIATACQDETARVWDASTGEPVTPPLRPGYAFRHIQFAAAGQAIVTRNQDGLSSLWRLHPDEHDLEELAALAQLLSGQRGDYRSDYTGGTVPENPATLREIWTLLRSTRPDDFSVSPAEIVQWHLRQARSSEAAEQWAAALYHWDCLAQADPGRPAYAAQRDQAKERTNLQPKDAHGPGK